MPVPCNCAQKSDTISWFFQNLSSLFLNVLILSDDITELGKQTASTGATEHQLYNKNDNHNSLKRQYLGNQYCQPVQWKSGKIINRIFIYQRQIIHRVACLEIQHFTTIIYIFKDLLARHLCNTMLMVSFIICDCWCHLKIVVLKCHRGWVSVKIKRWHCVAVWVHSNQAG